MERLVVRYLEERQGVSTTLTTATAEAVHLVAVAGAELRCVLAVEGGSDRAALNVLAARLGRDLAAEGVAIVALGGASNLGHLLRGLADRHPEVRVVGLCDVDQEGSYRRYLEAAGLGAELDRANMERLGFFVCEADLEDELIRALGVGTAKGVIATQGERSSFDIFRKQPAQRERAVESQIHRFIGTRSGRKLRYGHAMVEALDLGSIPRPLAAVLAKVP